MIRRTSSSTERFHLLHKERNECTGVLDTCLRLLIEIGLVSGTATFGHAQETIFCAVCGLNVYLCRQVALGVYLIVHVQRRILRVTQVALGVGIEHAFAQCLFILKACPYLLTFLTMNDSGSCVLTERQLTFASHFGIAQEGQCYILVISTCLRVTQDFRYLFIVRTTKHETHVMKSLLSHQRQCLRSYF